MTAARRSAGGPALVVASVAVALAFAWPLLYLTTRALGADGGVWAAWTDDRTARPLQHTLVLATSVAAVASAVGTAVAWLAVRSDIPLRRLWAVLAPLPLVVPSFVGAAALLAAVAPGGLLEELLGPLGVDRLPTVDGFRGAFLVLTLFTYPYVYLPVAARLSMLPASLEESARTLGARPLRVFRTVVLPQISSAIWAGGLLVFLYVVSDYGAVAAMRYTTLTVEIFEAKLYDQDRALALGMLLAGVALLVVAVERAFGRRRAAVESGSPTRSHRVHLGRWRWPALVLIVVFLVNALLGPLAVLAFWAWRGLTASSGSLGSADLADLVEPAANSAGLGIGAALLALVLVLPVAYLTIRRPGPLAGSVNAVVVAGFALPGLLIALSLVAWVLEAPFVAGLYQTVPLLLIAYAVHFGAQAMRSTQVSVASVPRRLDEVARTLGAGPWRRFRTIEFPLLVPGLLAGAGLVLLSTMKELPATLLLRPTGVETLAVRIWDAREAADWGMTGLASIVLVATSGVLTWFLIVRRVERF